MNKLAFKARVLKLRKFRVTNKPVYRKLKTETLKEFGVSLASLYRHMAKRIPAVRKRRSDAGKEKRPVSAKSKKIITELQLSGMKKYKAVNKAKEITGESISTVKQVGLEKDTDTEKSLFGSAAKEFIRRLLELDLIGPDSGLFFKHKSVAFKVRKEYLEDIALILSTAYNESINGADDGKMMIDRDQKMKSQLYHLVQEALRVATEQFDFKMITSLATIYRNLKESDKDFDTDIETFFKCMSFLKKDITKSECIALIKRFS